ncbi:MAG: hypothetical protein BM564_13395 [Bacteroidetes bacterium MedPE-SWsnd-G2]|nr:MAG: hypothetical protein BM564_13395 [Bacteroidetes bacterium MedPE-SWsnd-G2]
MTLEKFNYICLIWGIIAIFTFVLLQFVKAPYGRHVRKGWGPEISNKLGWIIMEFPSFGIILYFYISSNQSSYASILSLLWLFHYFNRTFIFPFKIRTKGKKMPIIIVLSAIIFNSINAGLNGYFFSSLETYTDSSFLNWKFVLGISIFIIGFIVNQVSDYKLINLRKPGELDYKIPRGFLFDFISCPNLLGELAQWLGFAIMAWNYPATSFLVWTAANLIPRAISHHNWYKKQFKNYPKNRGALVPKIW